MTDTDFDNGFVCLSEGKITAVGDMASMPKLSSDDQVIDAKGMYLMPGLIDSHCHIGIVEDSIGFEGDDVNEMTNPITPHLRAIDGIYHADKSFEEARQSGVTTVITGPGSANVIGGQFAALKTYGRNVDEMTIKAPCAMKIAFGKTQRQYTMRSISSVNPYGYCSHTQGTTLQGKRIPLKLLENMKKTRKKTKTRIRHKT